MIFGAAHPRRVIWCHNGKGMEAPVAAALGKLDAFNLFDPFWMDPEYDIWYDLLNCGIRLPASTGSDWFICSNNRVSVQTGGGFEYDRWLSNLRVGRSFITNGPSLMIRVNDSGPGANLTLDPGARVEVSVSWISHYPLNRVEIIQDGQIVETRFYPEGSSTGEINSTLPVPGNSWIAARCGSDARDSFFHAIYAHTSPVYIRTGRTSEHQVLSSQSFLRALEHSLEWIGRTARFTTDEQRAEVVDLFQRARQVYARLANNEEIITGTAGGSEIP